MTAPRFPNAFKNAHIPREAAEWLATTSQVDVLRVHQHLHNKGPFDAATVDVPLLVGDLLPIGYRFTMPGYGPCEIVDWLMVRDPEQSGFDPSPQFDYGVAYGPEQAWKRMTHAFIAGVDGVQEGWWYDGPLAGPPPVKTALLPDPCGDKEYIGDGVYVTCKLPPGHPGRHQSERVGARPRMWPK